MDTTARRRPLVRGTIVAAVALVAALLAAGIWVAIDDGDPAAEPDEVIQFTPLDKEPEGLIAGDKTGEPAPASTFVRLGGGTARFADYRGKPLLVNFFASWCVPCRKEMPDIEKVHRALGDRVTVLGLAVRDSEADAAELVGKTGVTYDIARDPSGKLFLELGGINMPSTFLVSAEGRIIEAIPGALSEKELRELIAENFGVS